MSPIKIKPAYSVDSDEENELPLMKSIKSSPSTIDSPISDTKKCDSFISEDEEELCR